MSATLPATDSKADLASLGTDVEMPALPDVETERLTKRTM